MAKTRISEYSTTNSSNTDINSINIDEGCAPSGINNAIREVMVHLKNWQTNASGDGATFANLVVQGTGSFTGAVTMSAGTTLSGTNTLSGSNIISGNINSSGTTNTFSGGNILSGTNTISGSAIISGNINSSGTNTFSGTTVMSGANSIALAAGSASAPSLLANGDTNTGVFFPTADTVAVATGGVERWRTDSSGNLGLGVTPSATSGLSIQVGGASGKPALNFNNTLSAEGWITANSYWNGTNWIRILGGGYTSNAYSQNEQGQHRWYLGAAGTAETAITFTQAMTLDASGNLLVGKTSATANGGVLQVSNGITFPATQSACSDVNTLDDYEEGTWTPTLEGSTGSSGNTYTTQLGTYVKVGSVVVCTAAITINNWGTNTGSATLVKGLPFTTGASVYPFTTIGWDTLNANYVNIQAYANPSATNIVLTGATAAAATSLGFVPPTSIKNGSTIYFTFTYRST